MENIYHNFVLIISLLLIGAFLFGCAGQSTTAQVSHGITYTTGVGTGAQNIASLPAAREGQPYSAAITPSGGSPPYRCTSVPAGSAIIGDIRLNEGCTITGTAPILSSGTTHAAYPVKFMITDASGTVAGPFDFALEVVREENQGQVNVGQPGGQQPIIQLPQQLPNATVGKEYNYTLKASGGAGGPYSFHVDPRWDANSFPGSSYDGNGVLHITLYWINETTTYPLSLCVYDNEMNEGCGNTSLTVIAIGEEWTGTLQTSRDICGYWIGADYAYGGKLTGSWTIALKVPTSLVDALNFDYAAINLGYWWPAIYGQPFIEAKWSGSESATPQCTSQSYGVGIPGSVSDLPPYVHVSKDQIVLEAPEGEMMLPGGFPSHSAIMLKSTSVSDTKISGSIEVGYENKEIGTFTLTRIK